LKSSLKLVRPPNTREILKMTKKSISILFLTTLILSSVLFCGKTKADKDAEAEEQTNLLLLLAATRGPANSISYAGQQSGNQGSSLGLVTNVAIASITPLVTGATPSSYSISRTLPAGLSFNTTTGAITGTPTILSNRFLFTVRAAYSGSSETRDAFLSVIVAGSVASITCNQSGVSAGCNATAPFSCTNDTSGCYSSLSRCRDSDSCASF